MRNLLALITTCAVLLSGIGVAHGSVGGFDDVAGDDYFAAPIQWMAETGITTGTAACTFSPNNILTRGEGATFVWRSQGKKTAAGSHDFADVVADWQHDPVSWLYAKGYVTGVSPQRFAPDAWMTRAQFAVLLWRLAGEPKVSDSGQFVDVTQGWQRDAVAWMAKSGITTGTSADHFSPDLPLTRAQAATFLYRFEGSPKVSLDTARCGTSTQTTGSEVQAPTGTLGPRTTTAIDPSSVSGISRSGNVWTMDRNWDEIRDGGYLDFGDASLDVNGKTVEGFTISVPTGLSSGHVIDGGGTVGYFTITNPYQRSHNSYIRVIDRAHHYMALDIVGDGIKVPEGLAYHHDALLRMNVIPGGANDKHYDGVQVFSTGTARLERIVIDWNDAGTIANTTGAIFTQEAASLTVRDVLILDPGGTFQPVRLGGSGYHDVERIQVIGQRREASGHGKLAPTALVKITNGSDTFSLINDVPGVDDWLFE